MAGMLCSSKTPPSGKIAYYNLKRKWPPGGRAQYKDLCLPLGLGHTRKLQTVCCGDKSQAAWLLSRRGITNCTLDTVSKLHKPVTWHIISSSKTLRVYRLVGLGVWLSHWVREVPGSIPGRGLCLLLNFLRCRVTDYGRGEYGHLVINEMD